MISGPRVHVHLLQSDDKAWHAVVVPDVERWRSPSGWIEYPWGYHVSLPEDGSMLSGGLGLQRRSRRWDLSRASVRTVFPSSVERRIGADDLPNEAWQEVVATLERDHFHNGVRREATSAALWDEPDYDPLFTSWEKRTTSWNAEVFWRELAQDVLIAAVAASLAAGLRFALPILIRRFPAGCCASCGYDLAGLPPGGDQGDVTCPECGAICTLTKKS